MVSIEVQPPLLSPFHQWRKADIQTNPTLGSIYLYFPIRYAIKEADFQLNLLPRSLHTGATAGKFLTSSGTRCDQPWPQQPVYSEGD